MIDESIGKQPPPVAAQAIVIAPVADHVIEVVAELIAAGEQLAIAGETVFERVAPAVHHPRAWQHRQRRADQPPVVQAAVDEARLAPSPAFRCGRDSPGPAAPSQQASPGAPTAGTAGRGAPTRR